MEATAGTSLRCAHDTARCPMMSGEAICTILGRKAAMSCRTARGRPLPPGYRPPPGAGKEGNSGEPPGWKRWVQYVYIQGARVKLKKKINCQHTHYIDKK